MAIQGLYHRYTSRFDGTRCAMIFTGLSRPSKNGKTGDMIQCWFLRDDMLPIRAIREGKTLPICGLCPLRGTCCYAERYSVARASQQIWNAYKESSYVKLNLCDDEHLRLLRSKPIRFGAYGDPASVSTAFWYRFFRIVRPKPWTGYTHSWILDNTLSNWFVASVESLAGRHGAKVRDWHTFRILNDVSELAPDERLCPASKEGGHKTVCAKCRACRGNRQSMYDVAIVKH